MGGVRLSADEDVVLGAKLTLYAIGGIAWPILFCIVVVNAAFRRIRATVSIEFVSKRISIGKSLFSLTAVALAVGGILMWFGQPEQSNRWQVESLLRNGKTDEAAAYVASHERSDFPPHWNPPPRPAYGEREPRVVPILRSINRASGPSWFREIYLGKLFASYQDRADVIAAAKAGDAELLLQQLEYASAMNRTPTIDWRFADQLQESSDEFSPEVKERVERYLKRSGPSSESPLDVEPRSNGLEPTQ
jgi:hypothetical protein